MTDTDKLKRLAEAAGRIDEVVEAARDAAKFMSACSPETILALIAENDQLNVDLVEWEIDYRTAKSERDEAVALLRKWTEVGRDEWGDGTLEGKTDVFLARIDAKDSE